MHVDTVACDALSGGDGDNLVEVAIEEVYYFSR